MRFVVFVIGVAVFIGLMLRLMSKSTRNDGSLHGGGVDSSFHDWQC